MSYVVVKTQQGYDTYENASWKWKYDQDILKIYDVETNTMLILPTLAEYPRENVISVEAVLNNDE